MHRRDFVKSAAGAALAGAFQPAILAADSIPVIDAHIHLFDPDRPGGVPWPTKADAALYKPALPKRYEKLSAPYGIVGAIAIECSPWMIDNFWLQNIVQANSNIVGFIGDLTPAAPDFAATLDWLHKSPQFLGIRYGNLWNRNPAAAAHSADFIAGLRLLAASGLVLETANPDGELIAAVVEISDRVPELRVVLDHLPNAKVPEDSSTRAKYEANVRELARRPNIFVKGSEIIRRVEGNLQLDPAFYKHSLDLLWDEFGEDRIFFGSDWPNSDSIASYGETFKVAHDYIFTRTRIAQEKYFWKNSLSVYRWKPRTPAQELLTSS